MGCVGGVLSALRAVRKNIFEAWRVAWPASLLIGSISFMSRFHLRTRNLAFLLLILSLVIYGFDFLLFGRAGDIVSSFMGNLAFLPIYVLFVTLMIEKILKERERLVLLRKLNMVIGVFFSEVGTVLLGDFSVFLQNHDDIAAQLRVDGSWSPSDFRKAMAFFNKTELKVDCAKGDLEALKVFLLGKRDFLLRLLENQNLLEHDEFTDLLWAVFHLTEELDARQRLAGLPQSDLDHLANDTRRVFASLTREWLRYMEHLMNDYPYLFSLAVRTNPMNPAARVEVGG
jgi:hypothetical protein